MKNIVGIDDFNEFISSGIALVDFSASWCSQCRMMEPIIKQIETQFEGKISFAIVDADELDNKEILVKFGVMSLPTFLLFKNEELVERFQMKPKSAIINMLEESLK